MTSTPRNVIYFGGYYWNAGEATDKVVEYQNLKWTPPGNLAGPRSDHRSLKIDNKIYLFGGEGKT